MSAAAVTDVVDVRRQAAAARNEAVLRAFDALAPGERLDVVGADPSAGVLRCLQTRRKGLFDWSPLESGPERFRIEVSRRAAEPGALREVGEALAWDHDRLDALEAKVFERLAAQDQASARGRWAEFTVGLRRHIRFEEEVLFPRFEERCGPGPTGVMRLEHRQIEAILEAIGLALANEASALALRAELHQVLGAHNQKEEMVLYPMTDRILDALERDALVAAIQAVS